MTQTEQVFEWRDMLDGLTREMDHEGCETAEDTPRGEVFIVERPIPWPTNLKSVDDLIWFLQFTRLVMAPRTEYTLTWGDGEQLILSLEGEGEDNMGVTTWDDLEDAAHGREAERELERMV